MLLILFWVSFLMFYFSYLFSVMFLVFLVMFMMLMYMAGLMYVKYLVILVYVSGIVVFILYISCLCWNMSHGSMSVIVLFSMSLVYMYDSGVVSKFSDVGEFLWMFLFFSFVFNSLVTVYSLNLFKVSGSLRF